MPAAKENAKPGTSQPKAPGIPSNNPIPATKKGIVASWLNTTRLISHDHECPARKLA